MIAQSQKDIKVVRFVSLESVSTLGPSYLPTSLTHSLQRCTEKKKRDRTWSLKLTLARRPKRTRREGNGSTCAMKRRIQIYVITRAGRTTLAARCTRRIAGVMGWPVRSQICNARATEYKMAFANCDSTQIMPTLLGHQQLQGISNT